MEHRCHKRKMKQCSECLAACNDTMQSNLRYATKPQYQRKVYDNLVQK